MSSARLRGLILLASVVVILTGLSYRDLWEPDEPRIGMVAEELRSLRHGPRGLVLLHLSGEPYTQKPPLYYWLAALAGAPGDRVDEWAARIPSALSGIATIALTMHLGTRLFGGVGGALGGALLLSVYGFSEAARRAQLDVLLTLLELAALVAFWRWDRGVGRPRANLALAHAAMGLAVLTKGPVGFLVPLLGFAIYLGWERRGRAVRALLPAWALALSLGPGLVWISAAVALAPPGFFEEAVGTNLFGRFFAGTSHARPFYYYAFQLPIESAPWPVLWPLVAWSGWRVLGHESSESRRRSWRLLLSWVGAALLFFSLSSGKRGIYLLPCLPALSLLCADAVIEWLAAARSRALRWLVVTSGSFGIALGVATVALALNPGWLPVTLPWQVHAGMLIAVIGSGVAWAWLAHRGAPAPARFACVVGAVLGIEFTAFVWGLPTLHPFKSPRPVGEMAASLTAPGEPVGLLGSEAKLAGIAYYSGRDVVPVKSEAEIRRFLEAGGRVVVLKARKLDRLGAIPFEVRAELGEGRRAWLVAVADGRG